MNCNKTQACLRAAEIELKTMGAVLKELQERRYALKRSTPEDNATARRLQKIEAAFLVLTRNVSALTVLHVGRSAFVKPS